MKATKKFMKISFIFMIILILTPGLFAQEIRVTSPNGSEEFNCGQRISIRWTSSGAGNIVKIGFTRGSEIVTPLITTRAPNKGVFNYTIPSNFPPGTNYKIGVANADETMHDRSDNFFRIVCKPEVKATVATVTPVPRAMGDTVTYEVEIKNIGPETSKPCVLRFYIESKGVETYNIPALDTHQQHQFKRDERYYTAGRKKIECIIDYGDNIKEVNEINNQVESSIYVRLPHEDTYVVKPYNQKCSDGTEIK